MARYTSTICDILTQFNEEGHSLKDLNNLYTLGSTYIFGESATNVINDDYRRNFIIGFCLHYMFDEIGMETMPAFQIQLLERLFNNKDFLDLMFDNLDKQLYKNYRLHIKDTTDNANKTVNDDVSTKTSTQDTRNYTDTDTKDLTNERTYNVTDALSGTDVVGKTGTQANAKSGYDTTSNAHTGTVGVASSATDKETSSITNTVATESKTSQNITTMVDPDPDLNGGHKTTTKYGDGNNAYKTTLTDNLQYTDSRVAAERTDTTNVDRSRTRTIGQLAELPQSGVSGSDVIGSSSASIIDGTGSGTKFLSEAQISDYQSAGERTMTTGGTGDLFGKVQFDHATTGNDVFNSQINGSEYDVTHTTDAQHNQQITEQEGQISVEETGKIQTTQTGALNDNVNVINSTTTNAGETEVTHTGSDTTTYNDTVDGRTDYHSTATLTNDLEDRTTYGKQNKTTGTQTDDQSGTDTLTHTGTGSTSGTGSSERDIKTDEDKTGHLEETVIEMDYASLISATSLMSNVWNIFDDLFMQIY